MLLCNAIWCLMNVKSTVFYFMFCLVVFMIRILVLTVCGPTQGAGHLLLAPTGFVASNIALYTTQREKHAQFVEPQGHG